MFSAALRASSTVCAALRVLKECTVSKMQTHFAGVIVQRQVLLQDLGRDERAGRLDPAVLEPVESLSEGKRHV